MTCVVVVLVVVVAVVVAVVDAVDCSNGRLLTSRENMLSCTCTNLLSFRIPSSQPNFCLVGMECIYDMLLPQIIIALLLLPTLSAGGAGHRKRQQE
jgi:hypothetical protein